VLVTQRAGAVAQDTARLLTSGPLVSTSGWTSWQVSYATNVSPEDTAALAAQADSVFEHLRPLIAQRRDSTTFLEAHTSAAGGYRFL
jgi:hypothetical protein